MTYVMIGMRIFLNKKFFLTHKSRNAFMDNKNCLVYLNLGILNF